MRKKIEIEHEESGDGEELRVCFGPHYFVEVIRTGDRFEFVLGATHHGFRADASEVGGELERIVEEVRSAHPGLACD